MLMPSESADYRKTAKPQNLGAPPPEQEHLLCPRCDSINTKFCYYNNYNFSQPRHFCKSCRRYWTQGGTLRDIPFGGGSRKNAKRSRTVASTPSVSVSAVPHFDRPHPLSSNAVPAVVTASYCSPLQFPSVGNAKQSGNLMGSFGSLQSTQGPGFLALGGFGLGLGSPFEDVGFGVARGAWSFPSSGQGGAENGNHANASGMGNAWQLENGEGVFVAADCFSWPDLAISTPGNGVK